MKKIGQLVLMMLLLGRVLAGSAAEGAELTGDYQKLQGRWVVLRNEIKKQTTPELHGRVWIFEGKKFRLDTDKGSEAFVLEETTQPKSIDFKDGRTADILGIYKFEGEKLVVCTAAAGKKRPKAFKTSMWTGTVLTELKRP